MDRFLFIYKIHLNWIQFSFYNKTLYNKVYNSIKMEMFLFKKVFRDTRNNTRAKRQAIQNDFIVTITNRLSNGNVSDILATVVIPAVIFEIANSNPAYNQQFALFYYKTNTLFVSELYSTQVNYLLLMIIYHLKKFLYYFYK